MFAPDGTYPAVASAGMFTVMADRPHCWKNSSEIIADTRKLLEAVRAGIVESNHSVDLSIAIILMSWEFLAPPPVVQFSSRPPA